MIAFKKDTKTDLFQIGRSTEPIIDFIVVDTIPGNKENLEKLLIQSTISRYACRFSVERSSPHRARIYAAAFNSKRKIFLGVSKNNSFTFCSHSIFLPSKLQSTRCHAVNCKGYIAS